MGNLDGFDPGNYEEKKSYSPVPPGWYVAMIVDSERKPTRKAMDDPTGKLKDNYVKLTWEVLEGEYKGRYVWVNINLVNSVQKTEEIAGQELASVCRAVGVNRPPGDTSALHNKPAKIKVKIRPAKDGYEASNDIEGFKQSTGRATIQPAQGAVKSTPPWVKETPRPVPLVEDPPF